MFKIKGRKGQGSIEYLMILAAVLAIAVVVVVLATTFFTRYKEPAEVSSDKSVCGAAQVQLMNYFQRYHDVNESNCSLKIKYLGKTANCCVLDETHTPAEWGDCEPGLTSNCSQIDAETSCKIGTTQGPSTKILVLVGEEGGKAICRLKQVKETS